MTDPAVDAAQRAWDALPERSYATREQVMNAAAREALKQVSDDLQSVDGVLGLLHHRGLVDSERNRADVKAALEIVQRYTR
ncbi:hypothetical protein [Mycobacteroides abscessus]|uniref:hypothetical protein n=1 Tax=Mycobacteroides abscessus TaxID=36809 RepID=UPI0009CBF49C|nr:hypothetical protein [Mycobacteroides abscessus]RIU09648.1 hypothetical protein D2E94_11105 [Mycobacteroides abscessus]SLF57999.1 Uncharacterised protein [Mycobacteroides abscessus subsp. abscessus]